jgi:hypothetical protein
MSPLFPPGHFAHATTFLKWARHYYKLFQGNRLSNQPITENRWRNVSLAVILSITALEAFLNEMAVLALKQQPSPFCEQDVLTLSDQRRNKEGKIVPHYLFPEKKLREFTKIIVKKEFPNGKVFDQFKQLNAFRKKLIHCRTDDFIPISISNLNLNAIPSVFSEVEENLDFDPSEIIKQVILQIEKIGYPLTSNAKATIQQI